MLRRYAPAALLLVLAVAAWQAVASLESVDDLIAHLRDAERLLVEQRKPLENAQRDTLRDNWLKALQKQLPPRVADDDEDKRRDNAFAVRTIHDLLTPLQDVLVKAAGGSDDDR